VLFGPWFLTACWISKQLKRHEALHAPFGSLGIDQIIDLSIHHDCVMTAVARASVLARRPSGPTAMAHSPVRGPLADVQSLKGLPRDGATAGYGMRRGRLLAAGSHADAECVSINRLLLECGTQFLDEVRID